ncbi:regulator of microtubule dynamics protein 3 [Pseudoliparis swirei]|uniref:regulator of microtubule dynamics protein 3 n=1 Tax=Pseudoliparis swirei TaxID=2059687 RepID=UPI0024BEFFCA|nr:regulator of microtubule dynamics protein 3 [Pseudoliparis swirei]
MNAPLGRTGLIGLALGATAGCGLIALLIYREISRRRSRCLALEARRPVAKLLLRETLDAQEVEAQQEAVAAVVAAAVRGLTPEQQLELRNQLDQVLSCVSSLRGEVAELRGGLQDIATQIIQDVKKGVEDGRRVRRRRPGVHRERTDSSGSSSVYFTASQGAASAYETSEGGYSTAYAESDYTDRDTDREEGEREPEQESEEEEEEEEEEDMSCATVLTLREEEVEERGLLEEDEENEEEEEGRLQLLTGAPSGELALLLAQSDVLHTGDARLMADGLQLLLDNRAEYGDSRDFLWRLARAYSDMYESTEDTEEKKSYAQQGREEAESALKKNGLNAECHKWFALLTGLTSKHESMHGKLKGSHVVKEHLDRAIALRDDDPMCFYLLGRWCHQVATLDWLEKKAAAALYQAPPTSTLQDALENFLKAEELGPGFSRSVRLNIAQCHKELGNMSEATTWTELALNTPASSDDDKLCKLDLLKT